MPLADDGCNFHSLMSQINSFSEEFIWTHPTYNALLEEVSALREVSEDLKKSQKAVQENTKQRVGTLQALLYEHRVGRV